VNDNTDGCGGVANGVQSTQGAPTATFSPGEQVVIQWSVTIPHDEDRVNTGVRVAVKYSDTDGYSQNILAGGVTGDPPFTPVSSGSTNTEQTTVTLPAVKVCNPCTLQWVQAAQNDNGYYLYCADIVIGNNAPATTGGGATTGAGQQPEVPATTGGGATTGAGQQPQVPGSGNNLYQPTSGGVYGQIAGASSLSRKFAFLAFLICLARLLAQQ
jgi:hypothetical protein